MTSADIKLNSMRQFVIEVYDPEECSNPRAKTLG